jgi:hypothetical protein
MMSVGDVQELEGVSQSVQRIDSSQLPDTTLVVLDF